MKAPGIFKQGKKWYNFCILFMGVEMSKVMLTEQG
jgi:hypothetical protein